MPPLSASPARRRRRPRPSRRRSRPPPTRTISHDEAELTIGAQALDGPTEIGITPLTDAELPALGAGMENVTDGPRGGYRFTPTPFAFEQDITLSLPYDPNEVTATGYTPQDVQTFYYDEENTCWRALERVSADEQTGVVVSRTDHFTVMVNAVVSAPEGPEQATFDPTQIEGIQAVDPSTGVNQIGVPAANEQGAARLAYPIELPRGRARMEPSLAVGYSSSASGGWLGSGWDLALPSIGIYFGYAEGAFHKTPLKTIQQYDAAGKLFNSHEFGYFDDIRDAAGKYTAFQRVNWASPDDNLRNGLVNGVRARPGRSTATPRAVSSPDELPAGHRSMTTSHQNVCFDAIAAGSRARKAASISRRISSTSAKKSGGSRSRSTPPRMARPSASPA
jgi:hypothetical protein